MTDAIDRILDAVRGLSAAELDTLGRRRIEAILAEPAAGATAGSPASMSPNGYLFLQFPAEQQVGIVRKDYWDEYECLDEGFDLDRLERETGLDMGDWYECSEASFEYQGGDYLQGIEWLRNNGFVEMENPFA